MKVLVQRVREAWVRIEVREVARIGRGLLLLVGIGEEDDADDGAALAPMARKILDLRVMADESGRMNRSLRETGGEVLAVSQFTLHADCRRGRRPSFTRAARPEQAAAYFNRFVELLREEGATVATGEFGAMMDVGLINDGPVTIWLDSTEIIR